MYEVLNRVFGFKEFRPHQREIVSSLLAGRDVFAVMPTGGGKSLCYQLPARMLPGLCVVISPLISLMKDQVDAAQLIGLRAAFLNSSQSFNTQQHVSNLMISGKLELLYISPERFVMQDFLTLLKKVDVTLFAVDEAHCISEWGHDFRPDYLELAKMIPLFPKAAVAAFTATATPEVQSDIIRKLGLRNPHVTRASFDRPNLFYRVMPKENLNGQLAEFLQDHPGEAGIIYRMARKSVELTCDYLQQRGIKALPYHAGLSGEVRARHQELFNQDEVDVMVATIAFGMGIDKSNVRFVLHGDLPKNVESYYQETGRAGRDGEPAECVLYFSAGDAAKVRFFIDQIEDDRERKVALLQLQQMMRIAQSNACRRVGLLGYFGERYPKPNCTNCDVCTGSAEEVDAIKEAQIVMSAIVRSGQQFGALHVAEIVVGARTEKIRKYGHDRLKTYGVGKNRDKRYWRLIIEELITQKYISQTGNYSVLALTEKGVRLLKGEGAFRMLRQRKVRKQKVAGSGDYCKGLFEVLRMRRLRIARDEGVPPFVVFSDKTLHEMARYFPESAAQMRMIAGVGEMKLERYGQPFLTAIRKYVETHPDEVTARQILPEEEARERKRQAPRDDVYAETLELANRGFSLEKIAAERNLSAGTIAQHIEKLLESGAELDIDQFIASEKRVEVEALFDRLNTWELKPVVHTSGGRVTYLEARIVRAFMRDRD